MKKSGLTPDIVVSPYADKFLKRFETEQASSSSSEIEAVTPFTFGIIENESTF